MDTDHFKNRLEAEKQQLEASLKGVGHENPAVPGDFEPAGTGSPMESDTNDQATVIQSFEENEGIERDLEARYDQVLAALKRIEDGTYGVCAVSGEPIEPARLEADPAALTCLAHAA